MRSEPTYYNDRGEPTDELWELVDDGDSVRVSNLITRLQRERDEARAERDRLAPLETAALAFAHAALEFRRCVDAAIGGRERYLSMTVAAGVRDAKAHDLRVAAHRLLDKESDNA